MKWYDYLWMGPLFVLAKLIFSLVWFPFACVEALAQLRGGTLVRVTVSRPGACNQDDAVIRDFGLFRTSGSGFSASPTPRVRAYGYARRRLLARRAKLVEGAQVVEHEQHGFLDSVAIRMSSYCSFAV